MSSSTLAQLRELHQTVKEIDRALNVVVDDLANKLEQPVKEVKKTADVAVDDSTKKLGQPVKEVKNTPDFAMDNSAEKLGQPIKKVKKTSNVAPDDPAENLGPSKKQPEDRPSRPARTPKESDDGKDLSEGEAVVNRVPPKQNFVILMPPMV